MEKHIRLVVAFHTTAAAMAAESVCRERDLEGRLISVPRRITADCGLAWESPPALQSTLESLFREQRIESAGFYILPQEK